MLHHAFRPLDQFFVQWIGLEAQGALGSATFVVILVYAAFLLVSSGAGPLVARCTGGADPEGRRAVLGSALVGCAALAGVLALVGLSSAEQVARLLGLSGLTARYATIYLRTLFLTGGALVFAPLVDASFAAMGNTRLPMLLQGGSLLLNALLTPLFLFVFDLGVAGAALGTTVAQTVTVGVGLTLLWRTVGLQWSDLGAGQLARIVRIGAPMAISVALYALVYWALLATSISPLGPAVIAGLGIGFNALESFSWPLFVGLSVAASSLTGRSLGAGRPAQAWRTVAWLSGPAVAVGLAVWGVFWLGGSTVTGWFSQDPAAWREAALYASVLAWSQPFVALETLFDGTLAGAGDTRTVFWTTAPFNLLRVPLAWALAFPLGMGAAGVWWAINATTLAKAAAKGAMILRGRWATLQI